jgi:hypothetical protein
LLSFLRPIFRSYKPQDDLLQENVLPDGVPGEISERVQEEISTENEGVKLEQLVRSPDSFVV